MAYYYNTEFKKECLGRGISSLDTFETDSRDYLGKTKVTYGEDKIKDSIYTILSTREGERFFQPEFGSKLYKTLFEPNELISRDLMAMYTKEALQKWEKRITVNAVEVDKEIKDNIVEIKIFYSIRNSNIQGNYVYPFNLNSEGIIDTVDFIDFTV